MKITNNFSLEELYASSTAKKKGIDNTPSTKVIRYLEALANNVLQPIRDEWQAPIKVNCAYRCQKLNSAVGGAKNSDHLFGAAADITVGSKEKNKQLFTLILSMVKQGKLKCRQVIDESNFSWIHVSINNEYNKYKDNQILHL